MTKEQAPKAHYFDNDGNVFIYNTLLLCPFCGGKPKILFIGNSYTKSREVKINCSNPFCRCSITSKGRLHNHEKVAITSIDAWNLRQP